MDTFDWAHREGIPRSQHWGVNKIGGLEKSVEDLKSLSIHLNVYYEFLNWPELPLGTKYVRGLLN